MSQTTTTARAPYQVGDHVAALCFDARYGTCLNLAARVLRVDRDTRRPGYPGLITYQAGPGETRQVRVNQGGMDVNGYVSPSTSVLSIEEATRPAGIKATALAASLRREGVPGALATTTGGDNLAVVLTWPSGNDRIVVGIDVFEGRTTYDIAAYPDREHEVPDHEQAAHHHTEAVAEVARLFAAGAR